MNDIYIASNNHSPEVKFESNGILFIKGRSLIENANGFFERIIKWTQLLTAPDVRLTVQLDYFNTSSAKNLFELLKTIDSNVHVRNFEVIWTYEEDDEDTLEKGLIYAEKLKRAKFAFNELIEA